jgi:hypothetical protein
MYGPTGKDLLLMAVLLMALGAGLSKGCGLAVSWLGSHVRVTW